MQVHKKILSKLAYLCVITLFFLPLQGVFGAGSAYITLDNFSGLATTVAVSGGGWTPGETVSLFLKTTGGTPDATATVGSDSFFGPVLLNIPHNTPQGSLSIIAVGSATNEQQTNSYYVVPFAGSITVTGNNTPGSNIAISGEGFAPNEIVHFLFGENDLNQITANNLGGFGTGRISVPNVAPGTYQIHAIGQESHTDAIAYFYAGGFFPSITPSTYYLLPTQVLNFSGSGFATGEAITIYEGPNQTPLATIHADGNGLFENLGNITIPVNFSGTKTFRLVGQTSQGQAQTDITIGQFNPVISPDTYYLLPGDVLNFTGGGFAANEPIKIFAGQSQTELATITADADGNFKSLGNISMLFDWTLSSRSFRFVGQISGGTSDTTITVGQFNSLASPSSYHLSAGEKLSFSGNGFAPKESIAITEGQNTTVLTTFAANTTGTFTNTGTITLPFAWADSSRTFHLIGQSSHTKADVIVSIAAFTPQVSPSDYYVLPGTQISFTGLGFGTLESVGVSQVNGSAGTLATIPADVAGGFEHAGKITIPFSWTGKQTLLFTGQNSKAATTVDITIASFFPELIPSTYYVLPGQAVTLSGNGFAPNEIISLRMNSGTAVTTTATSTGGFLDAGGFIAPLKGSLIHFTGTGLQSFVEGSADITLGSLYPVVTPNSWYTPSGSTLLFSGSGFAPHESVFLKSGNATLATIPTDITGSFVNQPVVTGFGTDRNSTYDFIGNDSDALVSITVTIAALQPYLFLDNYYTVPGDTVHVTGVGFSPGEHVITKLGSTTVTTTADSEGTVSSTPITVPLGISGSSATVSMTGSSSGAHAATDISLAPFLAQITPSTWYTPAGSSVVFTGSGFASGETVAIALNGNQTSSTTVSAAGALSTSPLIIPFGITTASFAFIGSQSNITLSIPITVAQLIPSIQLSNYYANGGTPLTVTGMGFAANESIALTFDGQPFGSSTADNLGNFSIGSSVPYLTAGDKTVQAIGQQSGATVSTSFTEAQVYVSAQLGAYAGAPGSHLTIIGSGYLPNEQIEVTADRTGTTTQHFSAGQNGTFNDTSVIIPTSLTEGPLAITIRGEHSLAPITIVYYVTGS